MNTITSKMSRNRFQLLLKMIHFNDNEIVSEDRLQKIRPLLNKIIQNFQKIVNPGEVVCIDETLVPWRGRSGFRQYIANKRHRFGIKVFKLCLAGGYTYNLHVYCGQEKSKEKTVPSGVVMKLMEELVGMGRTLCTDNYYTSVSLAHDLQNVQTHLIGTLRSNRKFNPSNVVNKKLDKGETIAEESNTGVVVLKWKDKKDVLVLSTKHKDEITTVIQRGKEKEKPQIIVDYNKYKSFIDLSDQKKSYSSSIRRGIKLYRKLAIELLVDTAIVNVFILHQTVANQKLKNYRI